MLPASDRAAPHFLRRAAALPNPPTMQESGVKDYDTTLWTGMLAPAGTPREIVTKLNAELLVLLAKSELKFGARSSSRRGSSWSRPARRQSRMKMAEKPRQMRVSSHIPPASGVRVARFATPFGPEPRTPNPEPEPGGQTEACRRICLLSHDKVHLALAAGRVPPKWLYSHVCSPQNPAVSRINPHAPARRFHVAACLCETTNDAVIDQSHCP